MHKKTLPTITRSKVCNWRADTGRRAAGLLLFLLTAGFFLSAMISPALAASNSTQVNIPDPNLEKAVRQQLGTQSGVLTAAELTQLRELRVNNAGIENLLGLEYACNLEVLVLNTHLMTNQEGQWVRNTVSDLTPLSGLTSLKILELSRNQVQDISPLAGLLKLEELDLSDNKIRDISALHSLQHLKQLKLGENRQINDISALSGLNNLEELDLGGNTIRDLSGFKDLPRLKHLRLYFNNIRDIAPLGEIKSLQELYLNGNMIKDLTGLEKLNNLKWLEVNQNLIDDVSPLRSLHKLQMLDLSNNKIKDISPLQGLTSLEILQLSANEIQDLSPLQALISLHHLSLSGNAIANIEALHKMLQLSNLDLDHNPLTDISALAGLKSLVCLDLAQAQIQEISALSSLASLQLLELKQNRIKDIAPLSKLINLQRLALSGNQIEDISPLLENSQKQGLGENDYVSLEHNRLDIREGSPALSKVKLLKQAGVNIAYEPQGPEIQVVKVNPPTIIFNGMAVEGKVEPVIINGITLAPAYLLAELMGVDNTLSGNAASFTKGDKNLVLKPDNPTAQINNKATLMPVPPAAKDGELLVPVRLWAETFGAVVGWDGKARAVTIDFKETHQGLSPDEYLQKCLQAMETNTVYKFQGKMLNNNCGTDNQPSQQIEIEGCCQANEVYTKTTLLKMGENGEDISAEGYFQANRYYYRIKGQEWEGKPIPAPRELLADTIDAPSMILKQIDSFGTACSFGNENVVDGKRCLLVNAGFNKAAYVNKYVDFLNSIMENPSSPYDTNISGLDIEANKKMWSEMKWMSTYSLLIEEDTALLKGLQLHSTRALSEQFQPEYYLDIQLYDFNKPVSMPSVSGNGS